jgi:pilus assembly protein Flp/PilA
LMAKWRGWPVAWCAGRTECLKEVKMLHALIFRLRQMQNEEGATAVEYGIMVALIAAVIILTVQALGLEVQAAFQRVIDVLPF